MLKKIATHSGKFHADETLAVFMLKQLPEYANAQIIRTRDPLELATCDIVVDVGAVYDHSTGRYDHHQRSFNDTFSSDFAVKLSSAGLIYKHYGKQVLCRLLDWPESHPLLNVIYLKIYQELILMVVID